jgi:hypothetical protein
MVTAVKTVLKSKPLAMPILALPILALMGAFAVSGWAQGPQQQFPQQQPSQGQVEAQPPAGDPADAAENGVARISFVQGNVSLRPNGAGEQSAAVMNAPIMKDGILTTGENSQAEIQFDGVNLLRVAPGSEVRLGDLQYHRYPVQIAVGTATYRMLRDSDAEIELSLPAVAVRPLRAGAYRITVMPDGQGQITVLSGEAEVYSAKGSQNVQAGNMMMVRGTENDPEFQVVAAPAQDEFDHFNDRRDADLSRAVSPRYVPSDVYGTEQLDANGTWTNDPAYGNVWVPRVPAGWAPYRDGRWVNEPYYGWTWVSDDPWGWAPYHYGGWYEGSYGWAWYPGPLIGRHYWRPALVGFFGWGGGVGVGVGVGFGFGYANVGWVPLAPFEVYRPWYGRGIVGGRFNVVSNVSVTNVYRNARFEHGITSVRAGDFGHGAIGNANFVRPSMNEIARGGAIRGAMPFAAGRESARISDRSVSTQGMPRTSQNQRFFSRNSGNTASAAANNGGWRRLDGPSSTGRTSSSNGFMNRGTQQGTAPATRSSSGWQRLDGASNGQNGGQNGFRGSVSGQSAPQGNGYRTPQQSNAPAQQTGQRQFAPQQPVRISPSIVRDRGASGGSRTDVHGGFGGAHPSGGGGGGGRPSGGGSHSSHK